MITLTSPTYSSQQTLRFSGEDNRSNGPRKRGTPISRHVTEDKVAAPTDPRSRREFAETFDPVTRANVRQGKVASQARRTMQKGIIPIALAIPIALGLGGWLAVNSIQGWAQTISGTQQVVAEDKEQRKEDFKNEFISEFRGGFVDFLLGWRYNDIDEDWFKENYINGVRTNTFSFDLDGSTHGFAQVLPIPGKQILSDTQKFEKFSDQGGLQQILQNSEKIITLNDDGSYNVLKGSDLSERDLDPTNPDSVLYKARFFKGTLQTSGSETQTVRGFISAAPIFTTESNGEISIVPNPEQLPFYTVWLVGTQTAADNIKAYPPVLEEIPRFDDIMRELT